MRRKKEYKTTDIAEIHDVFLFRLESLAVRRYTFSEPKKEPTKLFNARTEYQTSEVRLINKKSTFFLPSLPPYSTLLLFHLA